MVKQTKTIYCIADIKTKLFVTSINKQSTPTLDNMYAPILYKNRFTADMQIQEIRKAKGTHKDSLRVIMF